jgi:GTPase SAR1 family protein
MIQKHLQKNIIILGGSGVGKTTFINYFNNYLSSQIHSNILTTNKPIIPTNKPIVYLDNISIDVSYASYMLFKKIIYTENINIKLLDTSGNLKHFEDKIGFLKHELSSKNIDGIIIMHDSTNIKSLNLSVQYYELIKLYSLDIPIIDVRNKNDIISHEVCQDYTNHINKYKELFLNFKYLETSSRTGKNVNIAFRDLFRIIYKCTTLDFCYLQNKILEKNKKRNRNDYDDEIDIVDRSTYLPNHPNNPFIITQQQKSQFFSSKFTSAFKNYNK